MNSKQASEKERVLHKVRDLCRAFGSVYMALARGGWIEKVGACIRTKGHGTSGGVVWRVKV